MMRYGIGRVVHELDATLFRDAIRTVDELEELMLDYWRGADIEQPHWVIDVGVVVDNYRWLEN